MALNLSKPISYLITNGLMTVAPSTEDFTRLLELISAAVDARISLIQLREKSMSARALYELTARAAELTAGTETKLLVNDRADIARAAGAAGVHLTSRSLPAAIVRAAFGAEFLIGVSTHSLAEARRARDEGADFAVLGPVFETISKRSYGDPLGLAKFKEAASELAPFPVLALGGVSLENARDCLQAGAAGIAGISLFDEPSALANIVDRIKVSDRCVEQK
jgi:thiamine-phosphate pyrophosphorylase